MALYDTIGRGYATLRRPDPRIAAAIHAALGPAQSVVNVGAGAGSYEPADRTVIAVEPSTVMMQQRAPGAAPCLQGSAESLPMEDASVDASMAILSAHHWPNMQQGLEEMARVSRQRLVLLTWVPDMAPFWLTEEYFPQILAHDRTIFPAEVSLVAMLQRAVPGARVTLAAVPIPHDCMDGMLCAYWRRPHCYLDAHVRSAISSFARIDPAQGLAALERDLASGVWMERHQHVMRLQEMDLGYRIAVCERVPWRTLHA